MFRRVIGLIVTAVAAFTATMRFTDARGASPRAPAAVLPALHSRETVRDSAREPVRPRNTVRPEAMRNSRADVPFFIERNVGQMPAGWDFLARCRGYVAGLRSGEIVVRAHDGARISLRLEGATASPPDSGGYERPGRVNHLRGSDPSRWVRRVPVVAGAAWPGAAPDTCWTVELRDRRLEFAVTLPGAAEPRIEIGGALALRPGPGGTLHAETATGLLVVGAPAAWQTTQDARSVPVAASWAIDGDGLARVELGPRDPLLPTCVDPAVEYLSYAGGSEDDSIRGVASDPATGDVYIAGSSASAYFTTIANSEIHWLSGDDSPSGSEYWCARLAADGHTLGWCTFIGGGRPDGAFDFALEENGNPVFAGMDSSGFPTTPGALQEATGLYGGVALELDSGGETIHWGTYAAIQDFVTVAVGPDGSTYFCDTTSVRKVSSDGRTSPWVVRLTPTTTLSGESTTFTRVRADDSGNVFVVGQSNQSNFGHTSGAVRTQPAGGFDVIVVKLAPDGTKVWSTLIGGAQDDVARDVAPDAQGRIVVAGSTLSTDFPVTAGAIRSSSGGLRDAFVLRLSSDGTALSWSSYLGGVGADDCLALRVHPTGAAYLCGSTASYDFPTQQPTTSAHGGATDGFLTVVDSANGLAFSSCVMATSGSTLVSSVAAAMDSTAVLGCTTAVSDLPTYHALQPSLRRYDDGAFMGISDVLLGSADSPAVTTTSITPLTAGSPATRTLAAANGTPPYTWELVSGALPAGISFAPGVLTGTPQAPETANFSIRITDVYGIRSTRQLALTVNPPPAVTTASLPAWTRTIPFDVTLASSGGTGSPAWSVVAGALPPGLSLATAGGRLSGTPAQAGTWTFTVQAADQNGGRGNRELTIVVAQVPSVDATPVPDWTEGRPWTCAFAVSGGTAPFAWTIADGAVPVPADIDPDTGRLHGVALAAGDYSFRIRVADARGASAERAFSAHINGPPRIVTVDLPFAVAARPYLSRLEGAGGTAPARWNLESGQIPGGVSLEVSTGRLAGTPTEATDGVLVVTLTDAAGASDRRAIGLQAAGLGDVSSRKASLDFDVRIGGGGRSLRCLELVAGTVLDLKVTGGVGAGTPPNVRVFAADGTEIDVAAWLKASKKGTRLRSYPVPSTGRWFVAIEPAPGAGGRVRASLAVIPPSKWTGVADVTPDGVTSVSLAAPPGSSVVSVVVKPAKRSAAIPVIRGFLDGSGAELVVPGSVVVKGRTATFRTKTPLAGTDFVLGLAAGDGTAGAVTWTASLRIPKTYDFGLPDLAAGDPGDE